MKERIRWSILVLISAVAGCRNADLEACQSAKQHAIEETRSAAAEVADLKKQVASLSETEQGAFARASDLFRALADSGDASKLIAEREAAAEALSSFLARFPESGHAAYAKADLDKLQVQLEDLKKEREYLGAFDEALEGQDFDKAATLLKRLAQADIGDASLARLKQRLYEARNVPRDATLKELENVGSELFGRRVRVKCGFVELDQMWVSDLPQVRGSYSSPEGLVYSFRASAANKWLGFHCASLADGAPWVPGERADVDFQRVFAPKSKFKDQLMGMHEGAPLVLVGRVIYFGTNNWAALIVEAIE